MCARVRPSLPIGQYMFVFDYLGGMCCILNNRLRESPEDGSKAFPHGASGVAPLPERSVASNKPQKQKVCSHNSVFWSILFPLLSSPVFL